MAIAITEQELDEIGILAAQQGRGFTLDQLREFISAIDFLDASESKSSRMSVHGQAPGDSPAFVKHGGKWHLAKTLVLIPTLKTANEH